MGKRVFHGLLMLLCFVLPVTAVNRLGENKESLIFPYTLPGTDLSLTRLVLYRNEESGQLGLIAENTGQRYISCISVKLKTNLGTFCFETNFLPPGERAVLWDTSPMEELPLILDISGEVTQTYSPFLPEGKVLVTEDENGLWVENRTEETIPSLWVYYAAYDAVRALYWDKAYITSVHGLRPGEKRFLPVTQDGKYPPRVIGFRRK